MAHEIKSSKQYKNVIKLTISEDTACVPSKTSYIEDGFDKNGIYYFGKKPNLPINWRDNFKAKKQNRATNERMINMKLRLKENVEDVNQYFEIDSKQVKDSDGYLTDYTMYMRVNTSSDNWFRFLKSKNPTAESIPDEWKSYVFVFGDKELYDPEDGDFDYECESETEAYEWFDNYEGFEDEDDNYY